MRLLGIPLQRQQVALFSGDLFIVLFSLYLGHFIRFTPSGMSVRLLDILDVSTGASVAFCALHMLLLYVADAYNVFERSRPLFFVARIIAATTIAFGLQMAFFYALPRWSWGRGISLLSFASVSALLVAWRLLYNRLFLDRASQPRTLVLGSGDAAQAYLRLVTHDPQHQTAQDVAGYICSNKLPSSLGTLPALGGFDDLIAVVERSGIQQIVVALPGDLAPTIVRDLLTLKARGVRVTEMQTVYRLVSGRVPVRHINDTELLYGKEFQLERGVAGTIRRIGDVVVSTIGLVVSSPILLFAMLAVKLDSRGPVFYHQQRIGGHEEPFTIHKLRTMRVDAEADGVAAWSAGPEDERVTRVGKILRRTRIDELPQLWNVLLGHMSIVGPRPERPEFVRQLSDAIPYYHLRHIVKPGLTGWAQVNYGYGASVDDAAVKLEYDLYAIQHMSPALYSLILLKTLQTVLFRQGS